MRAKQSAAELRDAGVDSCLLGSSLTQQFAGLTESPELNSFYWYLVLGSNALGDGPAGFWRSPGLVLARLVESSGGCP